MILQEKLKELDEAKEVIILFQIQYWDNKN